MEVSQQVVALVVKAGPRGKPKAVAHPQFRQEVSFITELAPVNHRPNRSIAGESTLAVRVLKIVGVGFQRIYVVNMKHSRDAGGVFAIGCQKESLKRRNRCKATMKFPRPLAHMKAANQKAIERERR